MFEWRDGEIQDAEFTEIHTHQTPHRSTQPPKHEKPVKMDVQTGLALFTVSSVVLVFAGLALFAVLFVLYALAFG